MKKRKLDGIYVRIPRAGKWDDVCLSDMTEEERNEVLKTKGCSWLLGAVNHLAAKLYELGEFCDVEAE